MRNLLRCLVSPPQYRNDVIRLFKTTIEHHRCAKSQQRVVQLIRAELEMFLEIL